MLKTKKRLQLLRYNRLILFVVYLKSSHKPKRDKDKISDRTIANHLVTIRSVFAYARKNQVIDDKISPFGKSGVKIKFPDTKKVGIAPEVVEKLETVVLEDSRHDHARNLWLFPSILPGCVFPMSYA